MDEFNTEGFPSETDIGPQRGDNRDSLLLSAELSLPGWSASKRVRVRNLSAGGLMAEYDRHIDVGTSLEIEIRGIGWISGHIAWIEAGRVGIAFDTTIDPLLARKPVGNGTRTPTYVKPVITRN